MEQKHVRYDNVVIIGGTNNVHENTDESIDEANEEVRRCLQKVNMAVKETFENSPQKKLIIVETVASPGCDEDKIKMYNETVRNYVKRKSYMTVMSSSIIEESDFRHDGIHLNEIGITKLIEHVDNFLKNSGMKTVIKNSNGFLADRPYRKISREYIFGCKQCS